MANTNVRRKTKSAKINRAGGHAYSLSDKAALATLVLSTFNEDQYYRSAEDARTELTGLVARVDPEFSMRLAVMARRDYHMRTLPQILAATIAELHPGTPKLRKAISTVCERPDDMAGIVSYYLASFGKKKLPASIVHGLRAAFDKFSDYQLGKYSLTSREWKMIDVIRMVHPRPTDKNRKAIEALVKDGKFTVETWETELSSAGQVAESKDVAKADTWKRLIAEDKLGYMALLRNLRNICASCDKDTIATVADRIADPERVHKSKQFPFRFFSAYRELQDVNAPKQIIVAITKALDAACDNVPLLPGETAVVVDLSGSMDQGVSQKSRVTLKEIGALFGAILGKANMGDSYAFGTTAQQVAFNPTDSGLSIMADAMRPNVGYSTSFGAAISVLSRAYDRIVFMTDCQGWHGGYGDNAPSELAAYSKKFDCDPFIYCIDLAGYGTSKFSGAKYTQIAGFSERVFDLINVNEIGSDALINQVESITL